MALERFPCSAPGQFIQISAHPDRDDSPRELCWQESALPRPSIPDWVADDAFLRRPFSIADRWELSDGRCALAVISRAVGTGTRWLDGLRVGDTLNVSGPLGHGFQLPSRDETCILVGGGVGIPPLLYLARRLHAEQFANVAVIFGAMSRDLFPVPLLSMPEADGRAKACVQFAEGVSFPAIVTTNDGSLGLRGVVTDALRQFIIRNQPSPDRTHVFACGPERMLHAVADLTRELGLHCQLCIERMMGCGMGTCLSCVTAVNDTSKPVGWRWALACSEGPVFMRDRLKSD